SNFYQCINDVILWHTRYPTDWKQTWLEVQKKYDADRIVPQGVWESFNIDAHLNAAYVVIGLLYGKGNFTETLEISTRCGQDSDCNPATAAGILGTIYGYSHIPAYWKQGLADIEPLNFKYTTISLQKAYDLSYRQALEMIKRNGGTATAEKITLLRQPVLTAPLEVSHPGIYPVDKKRVNLRLDATNSTWQQPFTGTGMAIVGRVEHKLPDAEAKTKSMEVEMWVDGKLHQTVVLPAWHIQRRFDPFFVFELPHGEHELMLKVKKDDGLRFVGSHFISYGPKAYNLSADKRQ
ncbi:MAG: ADP-ribosylglycohydrolase family protein, partial [Chitinophagaceae bacterium]|nr:ADP-ribosylglycohydrolase family protein [Chitinophagaceae bacterium]